MLQGMQKKKKKKKRTSKWGCFAKKSGAGGNEVNILHCIKTYFTVMVKIRFGVSQLLFKQLSGFFLGPGSSESVQNLITLRTI